MKSKRLIMFTAMLVAAVTAAPAMAQEATNPPAVENQMSTRLLDSQWLPWLGCWELVANAVDYRQVESTGRRLVCVAPRLDGLGVNLTTQIDDEIISRNTIIADATSRPLPEADCSGSQTATWSADGRRLISSVDATCGATSAREVKGMSLLVSGMRWLELQSVSTDGGEHRELVVRHYDRLNDGASAELGFAALSTSMAVSAASARAGAAAPLSVDDVIEARAALPVEVVEAAIVESGSTFPLDADALLSMVDAGVDERTIDLMVAVSFPDEFVVDSGYSYGGGGGGGAIYGGYVGFSTYYPNCWGNYYSPFYGPYGPSCGRGWHPWYGYRPPYYPGGGGGQPPLVVPPGGSLYGGKVINRNGYSAGRRPENLPSSNDTGVGFGSVASGSAINAPTGASGVYTVRRAVRRDDRGSGGGGNGIAGSSSGRRTNNGGSVSRSGFSKPSSSGAPRSSTSGASRATSGARKAKAKPKGGGGGF